MLGCAVGQNAIRKTSRASVQQHEGAMSTEPHPVVPADVAATCPDPSPPQPAPGSHVSIPRDPNIILLEDDAPGGNPTPMECDDDDIQFIAATPLQPTEEDATQREIEQFLSSCRYSRDLRDFLQTTGRQGRQDEAGKKAQMPGEPRHEVDGGREQNGGKAAENGMGGLKPLRTSKKAREQGEGTSGGRRGEAPDVEMAGARAPKRRPYHSLIDPTQPRLRCITIQVICGTPPRRCLIAAPTTEPQSPATVTRLYTATQCDCLFFHLLENFACHIDYILQLRHKVIITPNSTKVIQQAYERLHGKEFIKREGELARYIHRARPADICIPLRNMRDHGKVRSEKYYLNRTSEGRYFDVRYMLQEEMHDPEVENAVNDTINNKEKHTVYFGGQGYFKQDLRPGIYYCLKNDDRAAKQVAQRMYEAGYTGGLMGRPRDTQQPSGPRVQSPPPPQRPYPPIEHRYQRGNGTRRDRYPRKRWRDDRFITRRRHQMAPRVLFGKGRGRRRDGYIRDRQGPIFGENPRTNRWVAQGKKEQLRLAAQGRHIGDRRVAPRDDVSSNAEMELRGDNPSLARSV